MPYGLEFVRVIPDTEPDLYFNECCRGGDVVLDQLLPTIRERYDSISDGQEDWGWFVWFQSGKTRLAIDIFCEDPAEGRFRVHLTSSISRFLRTPRIEDVPELDELRSVIVPVLEEWLGEAPRVTRLDHDFIPIDG